MHGGLLQVGKCIGKPAIGKACNGGPCLAEAACDAGGACTGKAKVGAPCPAGPCHAAAAGSCQTNGTCGGQPVADGSPCDPTGGCVEGSVCKAGACVYGTTTKQGCGYNPTCGQRICCDQAHLADPACSGQAGLCVVVPTLGPCKSDIDWQSSCKFNLCTGSMGDTWACQQWATKGCGTGNACSGWYQCDGGNGQCVKVNNPPMCDFKPVTKACHVSACVGGGCGAVPGLNGLNCGPGRICADGQCVLK